jgi:hypothetical protein
MTFKVSTRLDDIYFEETFDTDLEALERAQSWTRAKLGDVVIIHEGDTYTLNEFEIGFALSEKSR